MKRTEERLMGKLARAKGGHRRRLQRKLDAMTTVQPAAKPVVKKTTTSKKKKSKKL